MKKGIQKTQPPRFRKPHPQRVSMGELHYFVLTFKTMLTDDMRASLQQQYRQNIQSHCPTLFEAMEQDPDQWDFSLTFTWDVPLPPIFDEELRAIEVAYAELEVHGE